MGDGLFGNGTTCIFKVNDNLLFLLFGRDGNYTGSGGIFAGIVNKNRKELLQLSRMTKDEKIVFNIFFYGYLFFKGKSLKA